MSIIVTYFPNGNIRHVRPTFTLHANARASDAIYALEKYIVI
ncbi:hypothetical protein LT85_2791 [Collimonas arenae]|uniref:Uncharacterized protein n=1 Tax=Collimonas arenae TaxID=279058 RepID=A0A0A1FE63_9BURK|nr:hypothetical protein LT85_2791 [Collimonas arenae]